MGGGGGPPGPEGAVGAGENRSLRPGGDEKTVERDEGLQVVGCGAWRDGFPGDRVGAAQNSAATAHGEELVGAAAHAQEDGVGDGVGHQVKFPIQAIVTGHDGASVPDREVAKGRSGHGPEPLAQGVVGHIPEQR